MSAEVLSPQERVERVRMALAEDGWAGSERVRLDPGEPEALLVPVEIPDEALWRALALANPDTNCWPCWSTNSSPGERCSHDPWASPHPEVTR